MSTNTLGNLIKIGALLIVALVAALLWYYTIGRKPTLTLSAKFSENDGVPSAHLVAPGQVLLLIGEKATLYSMASGAAQWSASLPLKATAALEFAGEALAPIAAGPADKPDPLLVKRVERRFAKLEAWAARLNAKRGKLKGQLQIDGFNEEAAKYHAELAAARAEAAPLHRAQLAAAAKVAPSAAISPEDDAADPGDAGESGDAIRGMSRSFFRGYGSKAEVLADGGTLWIARDQEVLALDLANGRTVRTSALEGEVDRLVRGAGCVYAITASGGAVRTVSRLTTRETKTCAVPAGDRVEFSAAGSELAQVQIRLIEKKFVERQVIVDDSTKVLDEADKNTKGGWGSDTAALAQVLAKDGALNATDDGKVRVDESTYEITVTRPFAPNPPPATAPVRVQGRPEVFSTATLDLVVAGRTVLAFDRSNRKLWESKLGQSLAFDDFGDMERAAAPCVEDAERLYLFDQSFLSALDRASGRPLWRLPSNGIRKALLDGRGTLYIHSANADAQARMIGAGDTIPLTIKVEARTGKVLWKLEKYDDCFVSGGQLYVTRETRNAEDLVNQVFDRSKAPETRFKLYKLKTSDGKPQWEWFQTRRPLGIESEGKKVSLLFANELQILKSIAL